MRALEAAKKRSAIALLVVAIAVGASACFPDLSAGGPADPMKNAVFQAMNQDRARNGVPALRYSPKLDNVAGTWAWRMGTGSGFVHQNLTAVLFSADFAGWTTLGENIMVSSGNLSAGQIEADFMGSPPHRANILNSNFNAVGVGLFRGSDGRLWVCIDFGRI